MILLFCPSPVSCLLCRDPAIFQDLNSLQHFAIPLGTHWFGLATIHQFRSNSLLRISRTLLHHIRTSPCLSILLTRSWPAKFRLSHFFKLFDKNFWSCTFSWPLRIFASSSASHTSILVCCREPLGSMLRFFTLLVHENPLFFWLRLELFTVLTLFYQAVEAGHILQCCTVSALASAINPSSSIARAFANSSAFSLPSVTNLSNCDICFFLRAVRLYMLYFSTKMPLSVRPCTSSQICIHKSASPALGFMQLLSLFFVIHR